jgi:hypothetical protein
VFTDTTTTSTRIEVLLELVNVMRSRKLDRDAIRKLLQPKGLPGRTSASDQANETLKAARELGLVEEDSNGSFRPAWSGRSAFVARDHLLAAIDSKVLSSVDIEPWFARFFAYVITKDDDLVGRGTDAANKWSSNFNRDLYGGQLPGNPFNPDKYSKLRPWMRYAGLGWYDSQAGFVPCPYVRVRRKLGDVFGKKTKLSSDDFLSSLSRHCPELDDGAIFREANRDYNLNRTCTRALAIVLRDLHDDNLIRLDCPRDSRGWSLIRAGVIRNPQQGLHADEFDFIELLPRS